MTTDKSRELGLKIRRIREAEGYGRAEFSELIGISKASLITVEKAQYAPRASVLLGVANAFPQYVYWLMTDRIQKKAGHVSPAGK
ncbi:MAG: helix-turn-helix domain-containing protein [Proteobacteria bacterium]|nr:helix-turn-helix domain-containing protein [Pseudomonadota bacterium]